MFITPAYAQAAGAAGGSGGFLASMLPLIAIFVIFYFLLIRPQQKRAKEHKLMVQTLRRGDQVVTSGGMLAKVTKVSEGDEIEVEIA
jgi:preprotein translocase subunit YajC